MLDEIPGSPGPLIPVPPCRDDDLFRVLFHYSRTSYLLGESINSGTWLTDNGALTASQANLALGLRGLPKMLYAIKVKDKEILGGLPVQWSPNAPYAGVIPAREWITTCTLPFTRIVTGGSI